MGDELKRRDELLDLALQQCVRLGRMPERKHWMHNRFIDYDELIGVVGGGSWQKTEFMIAMLWEKHKQQMEKELAETEASEKAAEKFPEGISGEVSEETSKEITEKAPNETEIEISGAVESKRKNRRGKGMGYTAEELIVGYREICEKLGTRSPTQTQIKQLTSEAGTVPYQTLYRRLGAKDEWGKYLDGSVEEAMEKLPETMKNAVATEVTEVAAAEVAVQDVLIKNLEVELEINGRPMRLRLRFGE